MSTTEYKSWELPPADPPPAIPTLSFRDQQLTIMRTITILEEDFYPVRIARGQATEDAKRMHTLCLLACAETLNAVANGIDPRPGVKIRSEAAVREQAEIDAFRPRARPRRSEAELKALAAPAGRTNTARKHERPFDDDVGVVGA